ncbi:hypothetical protein ACFYVL_01060 [Streptomyces sp. NPDC004111]|uniref:hypothetical protein n=1 Tax=Streptomyces sp. NPDC004111 TaxID=3364690 RepID=UPI00369C0400
MFSITQATALTQERDLASATSSSTSGPWKCTNNVYAEVCFSEDGDWFKIKDKEADGHSGVVHWSVIEPNGYTIRYGYIYNASGNGTVRYKNKNLPEGKAILIQPCHGDWGKDERPSGCTGQFYAGT